MSYLKHIMPCSICCEHGHNSTTCWNVCLPLYYSNDLKVKNTISKMDVINYIESTNESQGHGKAYEKDIQKNCFNLSDELIKTYSHIEKYDIKAEDNTINNRNVSIKTSSNMTIDCGDICRFLTSENMDIISVIYKQVDGFKVAKKTLVINYDDLIDILKKDTEEYCQIKFDEWFEKIKEYDKYVKGLSKDYYPLSKQKLLKDRDHITKKKELCENIPYFNIAPKIDSSQQRVQCSINLQKINGLTIEEYGGGELYDKKYNKQIMSDKRIRKTKSI